MLHSSNLSRAEVGTDLLAVAEFRRDGSNVPTRSFIAPARRDRGKCLAALPGGDLRVGTRRALSMRGQVQRARRTRRRLAAFGIAPPIGSVGRVIGNTARTCSAHIWQKAVA